MADEGTIDRHLKAVKGHTAAKIGLEMGMPIEVVDKIGQFLQPAVQAYIDKPSTDVAAKYHQVRQRLKGQPRPEVAPNIVKQMELGQPIFTSPRPSIGGFTGYTIRQVDNLI